MAFIKMVSLNHSYDVTLLGIVEILLHLLVKLNFIYTCSFLTLHFLQWLFVTNSVLISTCVEGLPFFHNSTRRISLGHYSFKIISFWNSVILRLLKVISSSYEYFLTFCYIIEVLFKYKTILYSLAKFNRENIGIFMN